MSKFQVIRKGALTEAINQKSDLLKTDQFNCISFRAIKDGQLQMEVCEKRFLGSSTRTLLSVLNQSDERFKAGTVLYSWLLFRPVDLLNAFPQLAEELTLEDFAEIANSYDATGPIGSDALVYSFLRPLSTANVEGQTVRPRLVVTERTATEILEGKHWRVGTPNFESNVKGAIQDENNVMRSGPKSDPNSEYIVAPNGDKVFRFTRVEFITPTYVPVDTLVEGKMLESQYRAMKEKQVQTTGADISSVITSGNLTA